MLTNLEMIAELEQEAVPTRRVLERIPEDRLDWRPHPKSLSLGQLAFHVATLPAALANVATMARFERGFIIPRPAVQDRADLLGQFEQSLVVARKILGQRDEASLASSWTMYDGERVVLTVPRRAFLRTILFNHWYHHRGQLTVYLRQLDVPVPAIYGDSADEAQGLPN